MQNVNLSNTDEYQLTPSENNFDLHVIKQHILIAVRVTLVSTWYLVASKRGIYMLKRKYRPNFVIHTYQKGVGHFLICSDCHFDPLLNKCWLMKILEWPKNIG